MYFNFDDRSFETPTVESAISWREQILLSVAIHVVAGLVVVLGPRLPFVQEAVERRAERRAELAEIEAQARAEALAAQPDDTRPFVFVQPRVELDGPEAPRPDAPLSDRDRVAQAPDRAPEPVNRLPNADGNSFEFVVEDDTDDGLNPTEADGVDDPAEATEAAELDQLADASTGDTETEATETPVEDAGTQPAGELDGPLLADSSLAQPGSGPGDPDPTSDRRIDLSPDGLLGRTAPDLRQSLRQETFRNFGGDTGRFGPDIQFDTKGVEFGPWLRRFVAQIRRNWFVPYAIWSMHGHVVLTFNVHRDGALTDLSIAKPSGVEAFNHSAANALRASNPTQPLPPEYPDDQAFFTVTFYFNELPPAQ